VLTYTGCVAGKDGKDGKDGNVPSMPTLFLSRDMFTP
jgi:hypothetical protein